MIPLESLIVYAPICEVLFFFGFNKSHHFNLLPIWLLRFHGLLFNRNFTLCLWYFVFSFFLICICFFCRNPSLELTTKARACKSAGQEGSLGVTFHAPGNTKECEGMNLHTPKGTPTLGSWSLDGLLNLQRAIARVKTH